MTKEIVEQYMEDNAFLNADHKLRIHEVYAGRFRVNVWQHDPVNKIYSSYFIRANESGVISCDPQLGA